MIKRISVALCFVIAMATVDCRATSGAAPAMPQGFTHVRTERDISEYRLDVNGLTVQLLPDHAAPAVTVMVTFRVGSRNESYGTTGATHLLEHLMFKGTQDHNKEAGSGFDQLMERTGAITNATTSLDRTNYFETAGSQDLPLMIALEADRMRNLRLREDDRRPEMTVVRNEYERGENDPAEALEKEIWATAFLAHPYHHTTIGWRSDFEKVPIEKLRAFYDTFYWPNNATLTVIGDFDPMSALELIKQNFGSIPRSPKPIPEVYTEEPAQTGPRRVTVKRPGELGVVMIAQKIPPATHVDYAALRVLSEILADGRNSRFYQALTDKSLTTNVDAEPEFNRDPSLLIVTATLTPSATHDDVEQRLIKEFARLQRDGVQPAEVAAAIAKITAETAYARDGSMAMADALNDCIAVGDWSLYYSLEDAFKRVTPADILRVAKTYFNDDQRVTGWFIPTRDSPAKSSTVIDKANADKTIPPSASAVAKKPDERDRSDNPTKATTGATQAKTTTATPSNSDRPLPMAPAAIEIARRIVRTRTCGIDLLVCPTGVKEVVTIKGSLPAYDPTNPILGELASEMLERGTTKHDARAITALLDQVGAQIDFGYEEGAVSFVAHCLKKDSSKVISLMAEQLRDPSFPSDEFEKLQLQKKAEAQQLKQDTDDQAEIAFRRALFTAGNPQFRLTSDERIAAIERARLAQVKAFHAAWFGPNHCTMVIVGDLEPDSIQSQVTNAFTGWKGGRPLPEGIAPKTITKAEDLKIVVPGKESVSVVLGATSGLHYVDPDFLPLAVGTDILGHGFTSRLTGSVRDSEGLTYGIDASLSGSGRLDQVWLIRATFAPSLVTQGLASTRRELAAWHRDGVTQVELDYRKSALAGAHRVKLSTSGGLAEMILTTVRHGLELNWIDEYPINVASLTLEQINSVIHRRVDPDKLIFVRAGTLTAE